MSEFKVCSVSSAVSETLFEIIMHGILTENVCNKCNTK